MTSQGDKAKAELLRVLERLEGDAQSVVGWVKAYREELAKPAEDFKTVVLPDGFREIDHTTHLRMYAHNLECSLGNLSGTLTEAQKLVGGVLDRAEREATSV